MNFEKSEDVKTFFNNRASSYHKVSKWSLDENLSSLSKKMLNGFSGKNVLEIGAGTGVLISMLTGYTNKTALDVSSKMLDQIKDSSITKVVGNAHEMPFESKSFDMILCRQMLHYCDIDLVFSNVKRVLIENGYFHIVQLIGFDEVPNQWDNTWAQFRKISNRRVIRKREIDSVICTYNFNVKSYSEITLRINHTWTEFFDKNHIASTEQQQVIDFFKNTPEKIKDSMHLILTDEYLTYNRLIGFWLLD